MRKLLVFSILALVFLSIVSLAFATWIRKGATYLNVNFYLIKQKSDYDVLGYNLTKVVNPYTYTPTCLVECHLPFGFYYSGYLAPDKVIIPKQALKYFVKHRFRRFKNFDPSEVRIDVKALVKEKFNKTIYIPYTKEEKVVYYANTTNITLPSNCKWINKTSYYCLVNRTYYNSTTVEDYRYVWKPLKHLKSITLRKNRAYVIDIVGKFKRVRFGRAVDIVPSLNISNYFKEVEEWAWWNASWYYRRPITITEQSGNTLTDYQVKLTIDTASLISEEKMNSDCSDIRFTWYNESSEEEVEIPYWIESGCNSANTIVWVKVPNIPANGETTIYMYYGNPSATSESNADNVFDFWDDGSTDRSSEYTEKPPFSLLAGDVSFSWDSSNEYYVGDMSGRGNTFMVHPTVVPSDNFIIKAKARNTKDTANNIIGIGVYGDSDLIMARTDAYTFNILADKSGGYTVICKGGSYDTNWHTYELVKIGTTWKFYVDGALECSGDYTPLSSTYNVGIYFGHDVGATNYIDDIVLRKYTDPEPTYSIGAEESTTGNQPPQITIYSPLEQTYHTNDINLFFKVIDDNSTSFHVKAWVDDNLLYDNYSYINNTEITINLKQYINTTGTHYVKVWADDTNPEFPLTSSRTVYFTVDNLPPSVEEPKTYDENYEEKTTFEPGDNVIIRVNVTDLQGAEDIDKVLISIIDNSSTIQVANETMVKVGAVTGSVSWWDTSFTKRKNITITEQSGNTLTDYQVALNVSYESEMQSDFDDLRFTYYNETSGEETEIPYWIEQKADGSWAYVWIKVPYIPASGETTVYMYYGNPSAASESNPNNVFIFHDDFSDLNKWKQNKGSACTGISIDTSTFGYSVLKMSVSGGNANSNSWCIVYNTSVSLPSSFKIDVDVYSNNIVDTLPYFNTVSGPFYVHRFDMRSGAYDLIGYYPSGGTTTNELARTSITSPSNTWLHMQVIRYSNGKWELRKGGDLSTLGNLEASVTDTQTTSGGIGLTGDGASGTTYFKNLFVRKYTDPEPTYEIGSEESVALTSTYEYNYTIPSDAVAGTWTIKVYANDTQNTWGYNSTTFEVISPITPPTITLNYPADQSTNTSLTIEFGFTPTDDSGFSNCSLWTNETGTFSLVETNSSPIVNGSINTITHSFTKDGTYIWNVKCFDDAGLSAFAPQNYTLTIDSIQISNIRWSTTAGDTDSQLDFYSYLDYINVTVNSAYTDKVLLTLINPDGEIILNNVTMTNYTQSDYTYDLDYLLYKAGTYTINIYANITTGYTEKATATFDVVRIMRALGLIYGFDTKKIPTTTEIDDLINNYDYNLLEIKYNKSQINTVWSSILDTISYVKNKNAMVALTARLDGDYTSETYKNNLKSAIMTYYPDLTNEPYLSGTAFLQIELVNVSDYSESYLASFVNNVSQWMINATNNNFLIYVKNFNSTLLDTSYVEPNPIPYLNQSNKVDLINNETYYLRRGILNRIYDLPTDDLKSWAKFNHENVILNLKGEINTSSTLDKNIVELTNNYLIVYNNYSSDRTFSISYPAVSGKDAYDLINDTIIELDTDGTISITLKPYNVSYIAFEDLDYIKYTDKPHIYRATREDLEISYTDGTLDSNWDLTGDHDIMIKLSDGSTKTADYMVYYGWINCSGITDWSKYELAILADKNAEELAKVESQTDVYGYMSMADYNDSVEWENEKIQEMEEWKNLGATGVFLNGIDIGAESGYPNFAERFKRIIDYAHQNLSLKVILNTYTFFHKYCTWGDYCMKESFCARWDCPTGYTVLGSLPNGTAVCCSDSSCTDYVPVEYSWEDFDIDRQRIEWYKSHGVRVLAMSFGEENDESRKQYCYHMAKIFNLPYYYSQPNFQVAHVDEFPDFGASTQYDFNQNNDYYSRLYTRGLVWINSTAKTYGFESYRNIESEQVCAYLYDNDDTVEDGVSVMVNDDSQVYTIDDSDLPAGSWEWKCFSIDQSDYSPTYYVKMWYSSRPSSVPIYIANDVLEGTGVNSWWDTSSENPPLSTSSAWNAYEADRNWMIKLIVNATYKGSIDTVTKIERSRVVDTSKGENVTVNISSEVHYPLPFIDKGENLTKYTSYMVRINFNGTWYNITPEITEDCDTDNPTWSEFTIGSTTYYSCAKDYGSKIYLRVKLPHLSTTQIEYSSTDTAGPEVDFVSQTPSDLSSLNILGKYLNITYSITDPSGVNASTVKLYHKTNSSASEIAWYINGTAYYGWQIAENYTNSSSIWYFYLDHQIYPGTYNLPDSVMRDAPKEHFSLDNQNEILKIRFFNVSNDKEFNYLVLNARNQTTNTEFLRIYYCNESYSTGDPEDSPYCVEFYDLEPTAPHNYTRDSSLYWIIPLPINKSTGYLANVYVTPTSYILLRDSASAGGWNISYVTNISRPDTVQYSSDNGHSYSNFAGTVDMHIHQFSGSDSLWYYVCANDTFGNSNCSEIRQDLIQLDSLPPSSPDVYNPTEGYYRGLITINYTQSISPNAYPIVNYTIDLVDLNENFVQKIADNDLKLSYVWNSSEAPDGKYFIRVRACDNLTQCSYGYSENITIDNTKPFVEIISPQNTTYTTSTITLSFNATDANLNRVWYSLNDGTNITITGSTILILDNGNYKLTLYADDKAGNENSSTVYFKVSVAPAPSPAPAPSEGVVYIPSENETVYFPTLNMTIKFPITIIPKEKMILIIEKDGKILFNQTIEKPTKIELPKGNYTFIFRNDKGDKMVRYLQVNSPTFFEVSIAGKTFKQAEKPPAPISIDYALIAKIAIALGVAYLIYIYWDKIKEKLEEVAWQLKLVK